MTRISLSRKYWINASVFAASVGLREEATTALVPDAAGDDSVIFEVDTDAARDGHWKQRIRNPIGEKTMRIAKEDVDVRMQVPGAVLRQRMDFGDATGLGRISAEFFSFSAGIDTTPLFQGLHHDACQCPHWGYVLRGRITTTDEHGGQETVNTNDLFYWPPGHNVRIDEDAEIVMFSPQHEHNIVIDHMKEKVNA